MGIFTPGFTWPGTDPELPADPLDYDSGDCGLVPVPLWPYVVNQAWELALGDVYNGPTLQGDGSISAWVYAWAKATAVSRVGYLSPSGLSMGGPTYSSIGNIFPANSTRHVGRVSLEYPAESGKYLDFAWGADPADVMYAFQHNYGYVLPILYACFETGEQGQYLGGWHTYEEANAILAEWESGMVTDCLFVSNNRVYADRFFFPLPWCDMGAGILGAVIPQCAAIIGAGAIQVVAALPSAGVFPQPSRKFKRRSHVK